MSCTPAYVFTRQQIEQPCVYVFWEEHKCLYVGAGGIYQHAHGLRRVFEPNHQHREEIERHNYRVDIYPQGSEEEAKLLEAKWTKEFTPLYNVQGVVGRVRIKKSERQILKGKNEATGEFTVVTTSGEVLFSSTERFEQQRFFMQECKRRADAATKQKADIVKAMVHS